MGVFKDDHKAVRLANHMANCSCMACANPRTTFGKLTLQEQKAIDKFVADLAESLDKKNET